MSLADRLQTIRNGETSGADVERIIFLLRRNPATPEAEVLVSELISHLSDSAVDRLVGLIAAPFADEGSSWNEYEYTRHGGDFVVAALSERGIGVSDTEEGWVLSLPDARTLTMQYRGIGEVDMSGELPSRDAAICRVGLDASFV
jgi:hypothetical protein